MHTTDDTSKVRPPRRGILATALIALVAAVVAVGTPASASAGRTATIPASPGCVATYLIAAAWSNGFQATVNVTNVSPTPIAGWKVTWTFNNGEVIRYYGGANIVQLGPYVTATNLAWNGNLPPNASTAFAFVATHPGANGAVSDLTCTAL